MSIHFPTIGSFAKYLGRWAEVLDFDGVDTAFKAYGFSRELGNPVILSIELKLKGCRRARDVNTINVRPGGIVQGGQREFVFTGFANVYAIRQPLPAAQVSDEGETTAPFCPDGVLVRGAHERKEVPCRDLDTGACENRHAFDLFDIDMRSPAVLNYPPRGRATYQIDVPKIRYSSVRRCEGSVEDRGFVSV